MASVQTWNTFVDKPYWFTIGPLFVVLKVEFQFTSTPLITPMLDNLCKKDCGELKIGKYFSREEVTENSSYMKKLVEK